MNALDTHDLVKQAHHCEVRRRTMTPAWAAQEVEIRAGAPRPDPPPKPTALPPGARKRPEPRPGDGHRVRDPEPRRAALLALAATLAQPGEILLARQLSTAGRWPMGTVEKDIQALMGRGQWLSARSKGGCHLQRGKIAASLAGFKPRGKGDTCES